MPLKVVIAVDDFSSDAGYTEYYLARGLSKLGITVYVFSFSADKTTTVKQSSEGFFVVRLPYSIIVGGYHVPSAAAARYAFRFIRDNAPDVVHCQPLFSPLALLFLATKRLHNFKLVGSILTGTLAVDDYRKKLLYALSNLMLSQLIVKQTSVIFALNDSVSDILLKKLTGQASKISIVPLGADPDIFRFDFDARVGTRRSLGIAEMDTVIVYSGKIIPSKDLHVLVSAAAPLMKANPSIKILMIGKGDASYISILERMAAEYGVLDRIIIHEPVHRLQLAKMLSAGDIAVWPGAPSISILEAASVRLPVISSNRKYYSMIEQYGMGFLMERGDLEQLRSFLSALIYDFRLRERMAERAEDVIRTSFSWESITQRYLEAYLSHN